MISSKLNEIFMSARPKALPVVLALCGAFYGVNVAAQGANSGVVNTAKSNPAEDCAPGIATVDRATCLKEATAAKAAAKRGQLAAPDVTYQANALQRCQALPASDKQQCELRIEGAGTTQGSVDGGGRIRELRTVVPDATSADGMASPSPGTTVK